MVFVAEDEQFGIICFLFSALTLPLVYKLLSPNLWIGL